ncbi:esterase-like activity of phytase family protein [Tropicimonas sediminicola]|uniref:DNA-binding beta-propeller fold protein YncE n=1 Tax=Tropicimonas sediminicola TaxID=1031541 RepID=A0A239LVI1_9RHOB|nr:esterase-like activity of phytase family protein [Tropicimonas sediminicola]SNT34677.1 DNA-binding beta-propeller fold protein YncE [Tropicimonas sediminicola]
MNRLLTVSSVLALVAGSAHAEMTFNRIASFATPLNMAEGEDAARETSAEIIAATPDGMTLVYTDSPLGVIGLIDITDAAAPKPLGNIALDGEPTSVAIIGDRAYVGVNTSESYTDPSGHLAVIDIAGKEIVGTCDLGGQPDSVAAAKDGSYVVVAIENERDEEAGDGRVGQMPAGFLAMIDAADNTAVCDTLKTVELTGLAEVAPEDPEPEFVDVNGLGETVVTLQENNHIAVVARDGTLLANFSAGGVDLENIDVDEEGALTFDGEQMGRLREPDAVKWLDDDYFVTANEGDMDGGSRGWTIFSKDGSVVYEDGASFEYAVAEIGHYPEGRSGNKGVEPESVEVATFGGTPYIFIGAERASVVGVYDATDPSAPVLKQLLPSGIGPEGYVAIPERNLLVSANETDLGPDGGVRAHVMIFEMAEGDAAYPMLTSGGITMENGAPVGWGAISGMVADAEVPGMIYAVNDSFYGMQPTIFKIDATGHPAKIVEAIRVTREGQPAQKLDLEGIALDGDGGFWLASEGRTDHVIPHALYRVDAEGAIEEEIGLPAELLVGETRFGFEGVTKIGDTLWMAVQREWGGDPMHHAKLVAYNLETGEWGAVHYPKAAPDSGWVGLSEIVAHGDWVYVVERDNLIGDAAVTKKVYRVPAAEMVPAALGGELPVVSKEEVRDLIPDLLQLNGYVQDKVEGLAIDATGEIFVSTDNDGIDDHSGETLFFSIGMAE